MISERKIAEAYVGKLKTICDAAGLRIVVDGRTADGQLYDPDANDTYVSEYLMVNETTAQGVAGVDGSIQRPVYQINVNVPKLESKWRCMELAESISNEFKMGEVEYIDAEMQAQTQSTSRSPYITSDTHGSVAISVLILATSLNM